MVVWGGVREKCCEKNVCIPASRLPGVGAKLYRQINFVEYLHVSGFELAPNESMSYRAVKIFTIINFNI